MIKTIGLFLSAALLIFTGCGEGNRSEAKRIDPAQAESQTVRNASVQKPTQAFQASEPKNTAPKEVNTTAKPEKSDDAGALAPFYRVFKDGASIDPAGKPMLLVFGQPGDPYTQKLRKDLEEHPALLQEIRSDMTPIYLDATRNLRHKFMHSGQMMDVDTKTLIGIYHIDATPTLIFTDPEGKTILIVPGYMPPKQFEATLKFVKEGVWRGKDRQNGEVYRALKAYYEAHGVSVGGAKKGAKQ